MPYCIGIVDDPQNFKNHIAMLRVDPGIVSCADAKGASYE